MLPNGREPAVGGNSVEAGRHAVLPHSPMEGAARAGGPEGAALLERGAGAAAQIGGPAHQVGHRCGDGLEGEPGRLPGGQRAAHGELGQAVVPADRELARVPLPELSGQGGMGGGEGIEPLLPGCLVFGSAPHGGAPVGQGVLGHVELGLQRPAHDLLGPSHLFCAQRRTMGVGAVPLGGSRIGDDGAEYDERGTSAFATGSFERSPNGGEVVAVAHLEHSPSVGLEPAGHVLGESE